MIRVLLADDHPALRQQLRSLLEVEGQTEICAEAADADQAVQLAVATLPDIAVLDLAMGGRSGLDAASELRARLPGLLIVIMTMYPVPADAGAGPADAWISKIELDQLPVLLRLLSQQGSAPRQACG